MARHLLRPRFRWPALFAVVASALVLPALAQGNPGVVPGMPSVAGAPFQVISPVAQPSISPGVLQLLELEGRFQQDVAAGGGRAFALWFADDAVTLANGKPAVQGRGSIATDANWDPRDYQLTWTAEGGQMGPSNDMGFTWGTYVGHARDAKGQPVVTSGRFITVWKKGRTGEWKVALDASANAPAGAGSCCTLTGP